MDLVSVSVQGWRRFSKKQSLQTNGKIVSILGPNEAGKSSLLQAIDFLHSDREALPSDFAKDADASELEISGFYSLDDEEMTQLHLRKFTKMKLTKRASGEAEIFIDPIPSDNRSDLSRELLDGLEKIKNSKKNYSKISNEDQQLLEEFSSFLVDVSNSSADVDCDRLSFLTLKSAEIISGVFGKLAPKYIQSFGETLRSFAELDLNADPYDLAKEYLRKRLPTILNFDQNQRSLMQKYPMDNLSAHLTGALGNLVSLSELDVEAIMLANSTDDQAALGSIIERANAKLQSKFDKNWSQSGVHVNFLVNKENLNVLIRNGTSRLTNLDERSDGYRQFVSLIAFSMKKRSSRSILLIDEAELHLHYDAQADLVQMLGKQEVASKVIYTTHSAGCLPEDLGNGVRFVVRESDEVSSVTNRFWGSAEPGFSPLLLGMGASTLAFFPTRNALMVEGEAEMLLLPSLLRRVLLKKVLGFQVVPGLSKADKAMLPISSANGKGVAFLVDHDDGGRNLRRELIANGADENAIFDLRINGDVDSTFEDLISREAIVAAANNIVRAHYPNTEPLDVGVVGDVAKFTDLARAYHGLVDRRLSKVDLAYALLDIDREDKIPILDDRTCDAFRGIGESLCRYFD